MKLSVTRFVHEPPALSIVAETDYEAAVLDRYWQSAKLSIGKGDIGSVNGKSYMIFFAEPKEHDA